jgi:hypothetical protein
MRAGVFWRIKIDVIMYTGNYRGNFVCFSYVFFFLLFSFLLFFILFQTKSLICEIFIGVDRLPNYDTVCI